MDPYTSDGQRCLFCGGECRPGRCDGRQGHRDHDDDDELPLLISGLTPPTWDTSEAAAVAVLESKDTQRAHVEACIERGQLGPGTGRTDDEIQIALGLDGSSERPRRWELWKLARICILRDALGEPVRRITRSGRLAVVWILTKQAA